MPTKEPEVGLGLCDDGLMHAFKSYDDGVSDFPMCGAKARFKDAGEGTDPFCEACVPLLCGELGINAKEFEQSLFEVMTGQPVKDPK